MSSARRKWVAGFYWIGVAMVAATVALVIAGHTDRFGLIERTDFPLTWACAGIALVALLAAELCYSLASPPAEGPGKTGAEKAGDIKA